MALAAAHQIVRSLAPISIELPLPAASAPSQVYLHCLQDAAHAVLQSVVGDLRSLRHGHLEWEQPLVFNRFAGDQQIGALAHLHSLLAAAFNVKRAAAPTCDSPKACINTSCSITATMCAVWRSAATSSAACMATCTCGRCILVRGQWQVRHVNPSLPCCSRDSEVAC